MKKFNSKRMKSIFISFYIVLIDQVSKFFVLNILGYGRPKNIIPNLLNITLVKNKGAAFSLFSNSTNLLTLASVLTSIIIILLLLKFPSKSFWNTLGLSYLLGGTLGNGIDRLFKGYVLDFIQIVPINFPIFNLADISINIAIVCFLIDVIGNNKKSKLEY